MSRSEFPAPGFDNPIELNPDSPLADKVQAHLSLKKFLDVVVIGGLAFAASGCEAVSVISPTPEGIKITPTEISPTAETGLDMNINEIPVTQESFGGTLLKGEITDVNPTDVATDTLKNKILAEFQASSFNPHSDLLTDPKIYGVDVLGSNLIDQFGNKQRFFFVRPFAKDGKPTTFDITDPSGVTYPAPFLFYTESDGKQFVPGGTGKEELGGRFLPVASYDVGELRYFGLVSSVSDGNINHNLFMTYDSKTGITTYTDPYSRQTTSWQEEPSGSSNDISFSKLASLISYRSIPEPIATPTPTPEQHFSVGMTDKMTMSDCNSITLPDVARLHADSLQHYQDIGLIDANGLATEKAYEFYLTGGGIQRGGGVPWSWAEISVGIGDPSAITCNIIDGNLAITVPMRAPGSNQVIPITFMLDQKGMENWYGPDGVNRPDILAKRNTDQTFANMLISIHSGQPFIVKSRTFILSPSTDQPELMDQWKASKDLLDMFNTQVSSWTGSQNPTIKEIPNIKTDDLFTLFILPHEVTQLPQDILDAIIDELLERNPVFPVETLGN